jgi:predicted acylesterase/phospholipase RssA
MVRVVVGPGAMGFFAELGAMHASLKLDDIEEISGSSAGALAAMCILLDIPFDKCMTVDTISVFKPSIRSFVTNYGFVPRGRIYKTFRDFFGRDWTFKELYEQTNKVFHIAVASLPRRTVYLSVLNSPDESVLQTITTSISIPFMFAPLKKGEQLFFDGSVYEISPGGPFIGYPPDTVIQYLVSPIESETHRMPKSILKFLLILMKSLISLRSEYPYKSKHVYVSSEDIYNFTMTDDLKLKLYSYGYNTCNS